MMQIEIKQIDKKSVRKKCENSEKRRKAEKKTSS